MPEVPRVFAEHGAHPAPLLRTVVVCDLCDSTALMDRLEQQKAAEVIRLHDRLARRAMRRWSGHEIDKSDGFLLVFERPVEAVGFALDYQRELRSLEVSDEPAAGEPPTNEAARTHLPGPLPILSARVGIHLGEILAWEGATEDVAHGAKRIEVEGVAKAMAARLMSLARPGQILMSGTTYAIARRAEGECGLPPHAIRWMSHGAYQLRGVAEPVAIYEVGETNLAPFHAPRDSAQGRRARPFFRRRSIAVMAVAVSMMAGMIAYRGWYSTQALTFAERDWVVIADVANVNSDSSLNAVLSTAFRIGLEQSRFVNVLSDMQVRQTLGRMQRDERSGIDRATASEIALREQARAVIVPSVAQYGTRIRVSAEVVDPRRMRTIATQFADANSADEVLPAIDRLLQELRSDLGESLRQIGSTTEPLEKVATPNLDALRALSAAIDRMRDGELGHAKALLERATDLDPGFATAYADLGSVLMSLERYDEARVALDKAMRHEERMTERERLFVHGLLAEFREPKQMLEAWQAYAQLYPDYSIGHFNVGYVKYFYLHDYPAAEIALARAAEVRDPLRNHVLHLLGHVQLAQEKAVAAEKSFRSALEWSPNPELFGLADALMAQGRLEEAASVLATPNRLSADAETSRGLRRVTLLVARGELAQAAAETDRVLNLASSLTVAADRRRAQAAAIAIATAEGQLAAARQAAEAHLTELIAAAGQSADVPWLWEETLYAASLGARVGAVALARHALELARSRAGLDRWPARAGLARLAQAEVDLYEGRPRLALAQTNVAPPLIDLWEFHDVRSRALRALGEGADEVAELQWMVAHRGLAHAQWIDELLGQQARAIAWRDARTRLDAGQRPR